MRAIAAVTTPGETAALCHSVGLARALAADERQAMLDTLHSERAARRLLQDLAHLSSITPRM